MTTSSDARTLTTAFLAENFAPKAFSHRDHIRVAMTLLTDHDFLTVAAVFGRQAARLAARSGAPEKFNTTMTVAFLSVIAEHMAGSGIKDADALLAAYPELDDPGLLSLWYPANLLGSELARSQFVMPPRRLRC